MKNLFVKLCLSLLALGVSLCAQDGEHAAAAPDRGNRHSTGFKKAMALKGPPVAPKFPTLGKDVERVVLDNGMVVYIQEDHRLPLVDAVMLVRAGKNYDSPQEIGTAALVGELLRSGGTTSMPPDKLDERIDFIAAELSVAMEDEQCRVSLNVPSKDTDEGMAILADVLRNPRFDESRLELAKRQATFALRASNDSPQTMMRREFSRLLYTEAHPTGRTPTVERISQITREDLIRFHKKYFHPNQIMIGLTGDFQKADMLQRVRKLFSDWPKQETNLPPLPIANTTPKPGIYYIDKPLNQSTIRVGHWGTNRSNPDRFAIDLMNNVLGGSEFSSRLMERIRNNEGLAYSAASAFPTSQRDNSFFIAVCETKTATTAKAIGLMLDEIQNMKTSKISSNEFDTAKEMFLYSYVFRYAQPAQSLAALMRLEYEHLPADYLEKEFDGYKAVTTADIERVAKKYLRPEDMTVFIVGDYAKFSGDLTKELAQLGEPHKVQPLEFGGERGPQRGR